MTATVIDAGDGLPLTVGALLGERAARHADTPFVVCDDDELTYAAAAERSARLAAALLAAGVGMGTHVGILHPNGSELVVAWLAAARIGAVSVPLSTFSTAPELATLLRGADVAVLLSASSYRSHDLVGTVAEAVPDLDLAVPPPLCSPAMPVLRRVAFADGTPVAPEWTVGALLAGAAAIAPDVLAAAEAVVTPADRMVIVHTSGSAAAPKGVVHTHGALIRHLDNLNQIRRYGPGEVLFSNSPFFWIGGFAYGLLGTLVAGATLACSNAPTAAGVLDTIERTRPTMVNGFAASVAHLPDDPSFADRDLSSIRRGNLYPIMPPDVRPRDPGLHHALLGMTEAGSVCLLSADESEQPEHRRGTFGQPAPGFEIRVVDPETGAPCTAGEVGELHLRGPFLMEGYHGRPRHEAFDPDGWYRSGDLVSVDGDGFVYFHGRAGDMIKTAGANVSPREVEAAIAEVAGLGSHVLGLPDPDRGEVVAAAIRVPGDGAVDLDELRAALAARLSAYKVPRRFLLLADDEVPMLSSGKLDTRALRARFDA